MDAAIVIVLAIVVPVILFPAALVWYFNIGGITAAAKEAREKRAVQEKGVGTVVAK